MSAEQADEAGVITTGPGVIMATASAILSAGIAMHPVNGIFLGLSYPALFGNDGQRDPTGAGVSSGLFLEVFQISLYPSWVRIDELEADGARGLGVTQAVAWWWDRLGLGAHFGGGDSAEAVFAMVANRLCAPSSKRRVPEWAREEVVMPAWFTHPPLHRYYRAVVRCVRFNVAHSGCFSPHGQGSGVWLCRW
ncbi:MAG: hypothetical protein ACRDVM_00675 [Acidimicrobiia bacterium]